MQKAIEIQNNGLTLRGMLHIPEIIKEKIPIVCIFHGFTDNKVGPHFIFVKLSRMLEAKGIASIRFDFSGSGESDGEFVNMTISKELDDAKAILNYAKSLDFVDTNNIGLLGFSMGGAVASMLAGQHKKDIQSLCLWGAAGNIKELIALGTKEEELEEARKAGFWDAGGLLVGEDFLKDALNLDVFSQASQYDRNVMLLHGSKDQTVPPSTADKYLDIYETKAVLHIIDDANHSFSNKSWEDEVLDYSIGFLEGELKNR
ncbi:alpha/beta hydrolase [Clostridium sp. CX1]|uniref:Alpha/beta hydrolase n=1 Tax=Clostridium tanneri TaxID=3037988 RepID=A0ABU4JQU5_9CLOT|nr:MULTISPECIES: alpha/beta hydrolase [unclassified Clostridium]MCT8978713.1 alpha/beta hydrolase [Clostridium sp. CX1]MDW8800493.1 alpha/beta hydrolase [Clostridium sp. A1-XYC3]